jgi:malate synthase
MMTSYIEDIKTLPEGIHIQTELLEEYKEILTTDALRFVVQLHRKFNARRKDLLAQRIERQQEIDNGKLPNFLPETAQIRLMDWKADPVPQDIQDRRVEITGPVERKMIINALNSGAKVFMADFEDSNAPTWENIMQGQINLRDALNRSISYTNPNNGKQYALNEETAVLFVRPRGWHLEEKHIFIDEEIASGSLVDFGLYFFHNHRQIEANGSGAYFYLPKIESHLEARLWNEIFDFAEQYVFIPRGFIKATVLIETILAAFEMHEIIYELRHHSAGLNCGRWDYIFSYIKKFRNLSGFILPDRAKVTMSVHFMKSYCDLLVQTCHRRGVHAMGGMAAQIPIKNDPVANEEALNRVRADKFREVSIGHDGTWVAHPGLVAVAMDIFNENMPTPNQIQKQRTDVVVTATDLLAVPQDSITEQGLRQNINVGILYLESWLRGNGAAAIYYLMEDAATAEISRTQVWQWLKNQSQLADGRKITLDLYKQLLTEELDKIKTYVGENAYANGRFHEAVTIFNNLVKDDAYIEFLTLPAYNYI